MNCFEDLNLGIFMYRVANSYANFSIKIFSYLVLLLVLALNFGAKILQATASYIKANLDEESFRH